MQRPFFAIQNLIHAYAICWMVADSIEVAVNLRFNPPGSHLKDEMTSLVGKATLVTARDRVSGGHPQPAGVNSGSVSM